MFSKTLLTKTTAIALALNVIASTASASCILVAADGSTITLPRGGCFYGATEQVFAQFGGLGCEEASQVFYIPEFNDRAVGLVEVDGRSSYAYRLNLHADDSAFGGGGGTLVGAPSRQIWTLDFTGDHRENISAFYCR